MAHKIPTVSEGILHDNQTPGSYIPLDSPQWFVWLGKPTPHTPDAFVNCSQGYLDRFMTVRQQRRQRSQATCWVTFPGKEGEYGL